MTPSCAYNLIWLSLDVIIDSLRYTVYRFFRGCSSNSGNTWRPFCFWFSTWGDLSLNFTQRPFSWSYNRFICVNGWRLVTCWRNDAETIGISIISCLGISQLAPFCILDTKCALIRSYGYSLACKPGAYHSTTGGWSIVWWNTPWYPLV
jgi:hypothetical protein